MESTAAEQRSTTKLSIWSIIGYVLLFVVIAFYALTMGQATSNEARLDTQAMNEVSPYKIFNWYFRIVPAVFFIFVSGSSTRAAISLLGLPFSRRLGISVAVVAAGGIVGWLWGGFTFASHSTWYSIGRSAGFFGAEIIFRGLPIVLLLHYLRNRKLALALGVAIGAALMMPALVPAGPPQIVTAAFSVAMGLVLVSTRSVLLVAVADLWYVWPKGLEGGQLVAPVVVIGLYVILGWAARLVQRRRAAKAVTMAEATPEQAQ